MKKRKFLIGRTALITGGAGGIGWGIAKEFVKEGAKVIIVDINRKKGEEVLADIGGEERGNGLIEADVTKVDRLKKELEKYLDRKGEIVDILVNNVGVRTGSNFMKMTEKDWNRSLDINLKSSVFLSQWAVKKMVEREKKGVILFTTSVHQEVVFGEPNYSASKAALRMVIKEMAVELAWRGIRVAGVAPGGIEVEKRTGNPAESEYDQRVILGERLGIPRDIGRMMVVLASDYWSRLVTGEIITVSGGEFLRPEEKTSVWKECCRLAKRRLIK